MCLICVISLECARTHTGIQIECIEPDKRGARKKQHTVLANVCRKSMVQAEPQLDFVKHYPEK